MKGKIVEALKRLESERDCRILFAVESGSRAWGFASPDSDYDVRAVYVKSIDWYLGLDEQKTDTWNAMLTGDLDISAWDLRKALRHMLKSNASFLEWLGSPIVYFDDGLLARLSEFKDACVNPVHVAFHYASMFRHAMDDLSSDGTISVKKLCYALRANLCVRWTMERETMPPTEFDSVCRGLSLVSEEASAIARLLERKRAAREKDRVVPESALAPLLVSRYEELSAFKWRRTGADAAVRAELGSIFLSIVHNSPAHR